MNPPKLHQQKQSVSKKQTNSFEAFMSQSDYDKLKEEYKVHFQKIKEMKERIAQAKHTQRISKALQDMDPQPVLDSVDEMIQVIREKASEMEAKISMAFESSSDEEFEKAQQRDAFELELNRKKAQETLNQIKLDMSGLAQNSHTASSTQEKAKEKTVGTSQEHPINSESKPVSEIKKTLGPKK